jgi:acetoin utilization protein AcuB
MRRDMDKTPRQLVRTFMTPSPHTVGRQQSLHLARSLMHKHHIRHLPVLDGGKLVGLLSERDLGVVEGLSGADPASITVEEAMTAATYVVAPDAPLETVAAEMAEMKLGSAVVMDAGHVVGVFTSVDALAALAALLHDRSA